MKALIIIAIATLLSSVSFAGDHAGNSIRAYQDLKKATCANKAKAELGAKTAAVEADAEAKSKAGRR